MKRTEASTREYRNDRHGHSLRVQSSEQGVRAKIWYRDGICACPYPMFFASFEDAVREMTAAFGPWKRCERVTHIGW